MTVKIAHAGPLTGSIAHLGKDDENGVALAIEQANAKHMVIDGKPVTFKMVSVDDQADPKVGTTVAQKLVDAKVAAVIGHLLGRFDPRLRDLQQGGHPDDLRLGHEPDTHRTRPQDRVSHRRPRRPARSRDRFVELEQGKVRHVGYFPELEDELAAFATLGYTGSGSPNRADALIWTLAELFGGIVHPQTKPQPYVAPFVPSDPALGMLG